MGLGAAGRAGNASSRLAADFAGRVWLELPPLAPERAVDDGRDALLLLLFLLLLPLLEGRAGNNEAARGGREGPELLLAGTHVPDCSALDRRDCWVEFFSLRTLVVCLWLGAVALATGDPPAADAHPLLAVVAPRIPPSPGSVG